MIANAVTAITSILAAVGDFLTPTASEGTGLNAGAVAAIAALFAVPIAIKAGKKAFSLIKGM